jgi:peptidoglycan hydrolase CwlO-like protein
MPIPKAVQHSKSEKFSQALKASDPIIQHYVVKLEAKNAELEVVIAELELKNISRDNRIKALEKERKAQEPPSETDMLEAARRIAFVLNRGNYEFVDGKVVKVRAPRGK